ncbi:pyridoxal phosphate-dependent aminotransferase [Bradyrhizobium canariense]|uniref:pyridoxal phosphate-dependent aminotransferase n=1 Tax=Bradyrhizobium canariense TaxID=255045 RepID=UPI000A18B6B8|nr:aminotransferase class I/II-fold pyridoxal phosphate-dependent enzyme [Bradyrhizobium canariense]OSI32960.1 aspartate aminotransferase [Bradyrhizobium canariense]OSI36934.1 aspartate aminotransferase [Bradyrhizobium canariense]OSI50359.1 aspartate aminotransferase [Bradyrhizobium canariense]OSI55780.1 aspartate aminotransferase [Bradyrhizobium canariense]OSI59057.1 aspartate aminotransferase [Bradyrhizobium canariense]
MLAQRMSSLSRWATTAAGDSVTIAGAAGHQIIDLATGDVAIAPPSSVRDGAIIAVSTGMVRYTDPIGLASLRQAVAERLSAESGIDWNTEDIVITSGAKEALLEVLFAVLNPGDEVIIIRPCWPTFPAQVLLAGAMPVFVDARGPRYIPDVTAIRAAVTPRTKAIIINSPNNPTGAVYDRTTLQRIGELAINTQLWIISDESYSNFVFSVVRRHVSIVSAHPSVRSRTIVLKAFAKELSITGWRLGYFAAPTEIVFAARELQSHTTATPNAVAQLAVLHHLQISDGSFERNLHQRLAAARNTGLHILSDLRDVAPPRADGSFFFYLDLSRLLSALSIDGPIRCANDVARLLLEEANVGCVAGGAFGDANGLRVSFSAPPDLLEIGLKRIVETLNSLRTRQSIA